MTVERVTAWQAWQWDCPCGEINEVDHDPSAEEVTCVTCDGTFVVEATR